MPDVVVRRLAPCTIVVYGSAPSEIFDRYRKAGIDVIPFECETSVAHGEVE